MSSVLVIGIGNQFRGDDQAGLIAARALKNATKDNLEQLEIRECDGSAFILMDLWRDRDYVIVIDAVRDPSQPIGTIVLIDGLKGPLPSEPSETSTHAFGLKAAIDLSRALGVLPKRLIIAGIVGQAFQMGGTISDDVAKAARSICSCWPLQVDQDVFELRT